jgi:hypothetical protein
MVDGRWLMGNSRWLIICLCFFVLIFFSSFQFIFQNPKSNFTLIKSIPIEAKDIQTDRLGNVFIITKTNQLYKYSADGKLLSTLNYTYLGNISSIDPTNPLEVYVFYKELNLVLFLDNNLAYRGEMDLSDYGIGQAASVARSYDNGLWVFDIGDMQLKKMSKNGDVLQSSGNVKQFVNASVSPNYMYDNNDRVFVNDSTIGILVFNVFTSYIKTIPIKGCDDFKLIEDEIFYNKDGKLLKYHLKTFTESIFQLPDTTFTQEISIEKERLYLLKQSSVDIYSY